MALQGANSGSPGIANQNDIAQFVAKQLASEDAGMQDQTQTANHVMMMFTAIGKFVAFMFRATQYETVIADIFGLGTFIRNCTQSTIRKIGEIQFYPAIKL